MTNTQFEDTRWKDIYLHLKEAGFKVFSPGQHEGECYESYVVVKSSGSSKLLGFSSTQNYYDLLCYVPKDKYSELETYVALVEESMKQLEPMIIPTHDKTPGYYDDQIKAHMVSVMYQNYRKI